MSNNRKQIEFRNIEIGVRLSYHTFEIMMNISLVSYLVNLT